MALVIVTACGTGDSAINYQISGGPTCAACGVTLDLQVTLGDSGGEGALTGRPSSVQLLPDGKIVLLDDTDASRVLLFAKDGSFARRIGASGSGPGELRRVESIAAIGADTIAVMHGRSLISYFDTTGRHLRTDQPSLPNGRWTQLTHRLHLLRPSAIPPSGVLLPPQLVEDRDRALTTINIDSLVRLEGDSLSPHAEVIAADSESIWIARSNSYLLVRLNRLGTPTLRVTGNPEWFEYYVAGTPWGERPWASVVEGIWFENETGLLIIAAAVPAAGWRSAFAPGGPLAPTGGEFSARAIPWTTLYDTMVEVIDLKRRTVSARHRTAGYPLTIFSGGILASYVEDAAGSPHVDIRTIRVTR